MSGKFHKSAAAISDLEELFQYLIERNVSAAERFLNSAEAIFRKLASSPSRGSKVASTHPKLTGLAQFQHRQSPRERTPEVLHAARDWSAILEEGS